MWVKSSYQFVDPIADYMDTSFLKTSIVSSVGKSLVYNSKYEVMHTFQSFLDFNIIHQDRPSNQLLEKLFWKFVYT